MEKIKGFGGRLKEERLKFNYSQGALAELTSVTALTISQYENGKSIPSLKYIYALQEIGFDIEYLLLNKNQKLSDDISKKVSDRVRELESKIEEEFELESKIKLINILTKYYNSAESEFEDLTTIQILSKMALNK